MQLCINFLLFTKLKLEFHHFRNKIWKKIPLYEWQITNVLIYTLVKVLVSLPISIIIKRKLKFLFHDQKRTDTSLQDRFSEMILYFCSYYSTNFVNLKPLRVYKKFFQWKQKSPHDLVNFNCSEFYLFLLRSIRSRGWKWQNVPFKIKGLSVV